MNGLLNSPIFFTSDLFMINIIRNKAHSVFRRRTYPIVIHDQIVIWIYRWTRNEKYSSIQKKLHDRHIYNMNSSKQCLNSSNQYSVKSSILLLHSHQKYIFKLGLTIYGDEFGITNPLREYSKKKYKVYCLYLDIVNYHKPITKSKKHQFTDDLVGKRTKNWL